VLPRPMDSEFGRKNIFRPFRYFFLFLFLVPFGCSKDKISSANVLPEILPIAKINDRDFLISDLPQKYQNELEELRYYVLWRLNSISNRFTNDKILQLESEKQGLGQAALISKLSEESVKPTKFEMNEYYNLNVKKFKGGYIANKKKIITELIRKNISRFRPAAVSNLRKLYRTSSGVEIPRKKINIHSGTITGNKNAKVVVYEFIDYSLSGNRKRHVQNTKLIVKYFDQISWTTLQLPNRDYPPVWALHRLAKCADSGNYWQIHETFIENAELLLAKNNFKKQKDVFNAYQTTFNTGLKILQAVDIDTKNIKKCAANIDKVDKSMESELTFARTNNIQAPFYLVNGIAVREEYRLEALIQTEIEIQ